MLVSIQPVPFADAGRQRQYEAVAEALRADVGAPATVLLGNLSAFSPVTVDALLVRPTGLTLVFLLPCAGELTLPESAGRPWLLDGQPLADSNPLVCYQRQGPPAVAWLAEQLGVPAAELPPCAGVALFEAPLIFGAGVEINLHRQAGAQDFQLVGGASSLSRRLPENHPGATALTEESLLEWADYLANEPYVAHQQGRPESPTDYLAQKLRQLWRWLGAEDIPADPPYGGFSEPDLAQRDEREQARLHQLRQELQAELAQQRRDAAAREAAHTQELAHLRQQLAQTGQPAATRQAEQRAQAALEAEMRAARTDLAARHRELDARIQELGQLMQQLQAQANAKTSTAAAAPAGTPAPTRQAAPPLPRAPRATTRPARPVLKLSSYRPLRRAERWGVLLMGLALLGGGTWGAVHLVRQSAGAGRLATAGRAAAPTPRGAARRPAPVVVYDTLADEAGRYQADETAADIAQPAPAAEAVPVNATPSPSVQVDSARLETKPTPLVTSDSAAGASPAP